MKTFWFAALVATMTCSAWAQESASTPSADATRSPQKPIVTARDDRPVEASSEDNNGGFYMGLGAGAMRLHRAASPEPGSKLRGVQPYVILRLGYDFSDSPFALEGFGSVGRAHRAQGSGGAQTLFGFGVEGLYHLDRYSTFDPFLAAGVSYYGASSAPNWQDGTRSHLFAQAGIGAFWHFSETFSLRGDLRYHVGLTDDFISFTTADISLKHYFGGNGETSADTLQPVGPIEPGALQYDDQSAHKDKLVDVTPVGSQDEMRLELRIQYAKDTALIQPSEYPALDELVRIIRAAIAANPEVYVTIDGHADQQYGSDHAYNQRLSEARAQSVQTYLNNNGISNSKMKSAGHSFDQPKDPVNLKDGTPSNRRTEIVIRGVDEPTREKILQSVR